MFDLPVGHAEHEGTIWLVEKPSESKLRSQYRKLGVYVAVFACILLTMLFS